MHRQRQHRQDVSSSVTGAATAVVEESSQLTTDSSSSSSNTKHHSDLSLSSSSSIHTGSGGRIMGGQTASDYWKTIWFHANAACSVVGAPTAAGDHMPHHYMVHWTYFMFKLLWFCVCGQLCV